MNSRVGANVKKRKATPSLQVNRADASPVCTQSNTQDNPVVLLPQWRQRHFSSLGRVVPPNEVRYFAQKEFQVSLGGRLELLKRPE